MAAILRAQSGIFGPLDTVESAVEISLVGRIKWATLARIVLLTAVLGFAVVMDVGMGPQRSPRAPDTTLYQVCSVFYFLTFFLLLGTQLSRASTLRLRFLAGLSVVCDAALAICLVAVTDGLHSIFLFAFPLAALNSALLLYRMGALGAATLSMAGLAAMGAMELGYLPWNISAWRVAWLRDTLPHLPLEPMDALTLLTVQAAAVYGTAFLAAHLMRELDKAREREKKERQELASLRVHYDDVVTSMPDGIVTVDLSGRITSINPAGLEILETQSALVLTRQLIDILPQIEQTSDDLEIVRPRRDQRPQVLVCRSVVMRGGPGEASPGTLVVFRDMTEQRRRDGEHRDRERMAAIGTMAAAVAHEIRNPLASISGSVQLLQTEESLSSDDRKLMEIVVRETAQLSDWICEFLDFAKPRPLQMGPVDMRALALETLQACRQDPRVTAAGIELRAGRGLIAGELTKDAVMSGDVLLLRQVLWNLLVNATQAVLAGERRMVHVDLSVGIAALELYVDDSGPGIEVSDLPHLFEPFFTTKGQGTGLGLATVKRHVLAHQGEIRVEKSPFGGARFAVTLPLRPTGGFASRIKARPDEVGQLASRGPRTSVGTVRTAELGGV